MCISQGPVGKKEVILDISNRENVKEKIAEKPNGMVRQLPIAGSQCHHQGGGTKRRGHSLEPRSCDVQAGLAHCELAL